MTEVEGLEGGTSATFSSAWSQINLSVLMSGRQTEQTEPPPAHSHWLNDLSAAGG